MLMWVKSYKVLAKIIKFRQKILTRNLESSTSGSIFIETIVCDFDLECFDFGGACGGGGELSCLIPSPGSIFLCLK